MPNRLFPHRGDYQLDKRTFSKDLVAGLTVAVVALPLALGFGITSGASAAAGLTTAIIAGFIAAVFGGSKYQVSGPTGAMTVVLLPIVHHYGIKAIPFLGLIAGAMVIAMGLLKLGAVINRVPWSVVEGFTVGIAFVIALQQIPLALGIPKAEGERSLFVAWGTIKNAISAGIHWQTLSVVVLTLAVKFAHPHLFKLLRIRIHIPASFVAIVTALIVVQVLSLDVATIGDIPRSLGSWRGSDIALADIPHLLWPAFLIALLCAIESLLSARVADGMVKTAHADRYNPNRELFGQGLATSIASVFGGLPATGAIARTSVNVRAQAKTRMAAIIHAVTLLFIALIAAPWVSHIPAPAIAGVLIGTSYRILNPRSLKESLQTTKREATVLVTTAVATLAIDLIWGIAIGIVLYGALHAKNSKSKKSA
ncbi:MAG: SulP family inorganic anion transporter [Actinobacteria bacterium]|nr:SulP family inorganic anion transporter [Actinomycetota bacterium]